MVGPSTTVFLSPVGGRCRTRRRASRIDRVNCSVITSRSWGRLRRHVSGRGVLHLSKRQCQRCGRLAIKGRRAGYRRGTVRHSQDACNDRLIRRRVREGSARSHVSQVVVEPRHRVLRVLRRLLGRTNTGAAGRMVHRRTFESPRLFRRPSRRPCHGRVRRSVQRVNVRRRMDSGLPRIGVQDRRGIGARRVFCVRSMFPNRGRPRRARRVSGGRIFHCY